ncbi:MAG: preprotein translocase subunit SecG [Lachnospiraceae bacterium]|nr:preprotein translocase subunit SecG [Lachnospiraceae bacterium]
MAVLRVVLTVIYVIDCIALLVVVLMQEGKQQGLGAIAGISDTYWGKNKSRSAEGTLIKMTKLMAILFIVLSVVLNLNF